MKKECHARPRCIMKGERNRVQGKSVISIWKVRTQTQMTHKTYSISHSCIHSYIISGPNCTCSIVKKNDIGHYNALHIKLLLQVGVKIYDRTYNINLSTLISFTVKQFIFIYKFNYILC